MGYALRERWVQAVAALLNSRKVKCGGVGDGLNVRVGSQVGIRSGNRGKLPSGETRDRLGKHEPGIEVRIVCPAAVASVPTGIHSEAHQIRDSHLSAGSGGRTAG